MNAMVIGVYGLYLILVGLKGNAGQLTTNVQNDAPKFLPWIIAIFVLAILHGSSDTGKKITSPFIGLLILTYVLKNFTTLQQQSEALWNMAAGATSGTPVVVNSATAAANVANGASTPSSNSTSYPSTSNLGNASDALNALENSFG